MTDRADIDAMAAEYVLGTLDPSERSAVTTRRSREPALDGAIRDWEKRLAPLNEMTPAVEPPAEIWGKIGARIDRASAATVSPNVVDLQRRLARWRRAAVAATAVAASLVAVIGVREFGRTQNPQNFVAVFQKDDASPAFLLSVNLGSRQLTIRPVAAKTPPGKAYQLWIAAAPLGGKPQSLGLVEA